MACGRALDFVTAANVVPNSDAYRHHGRADPRVPRLPTSSHPVKPRLRRRAMGGEDAHRRRRECALMCRT